MAIDVGAAAQKLLEFRRPDRDRQRQADARPNRIAAADPIPEPEYATRLDSEFGDLVELGRDRGEMVRHRFGAEGGADPFAGGSRVRHRLLGREGLRGDDEQGSRGVEAAQRVRDVGAVDVRNEMRVQLQRRIGRQRARGHRRPEVGAADADIDDVGHRLAERAADAALAHILGERQHFRALGCDVGRDVSPVDEDGLRCQVAQRGVKRRASFRRIDDLAAEHRVALGLDLGRLGERDQKTDRQGFDPLLREIEQEIVEDDMKPLETIGIPGEFPGDRGCEHRVACEPRGWPAPSEPRFPS